MRAGINGHSSILLYVGLNSGASLAMVSTERQGTTLSTIICRVSMTRHPVVSSSLFGIMMRRSYDEPRPITELISRAYTYWFGPSGSSLVAPESDPPE
jgi:hypothetical protein